MNGSLLINSSLLWPLKVYKSAENRTLDNLKHPSRINPPEADKPKNHKHQKTNKFQYLNLK